MTDINVDNAIERLTQALQSRIQCSSGKPPLLIGIRTGGVWIAERLGQALGLEEAIGELDISFYRDDFTRIGLNPKVKPSHLPFSIDDRDIILIDDVIMSGRTIRAAMNELFDYGRPARIFLVALVDIPRRELPIQPDFSGIKLDADVQHRIKLRGPDNLHLEYV
jgi:pyrimidine operon attenuation protein/uracil phosphoribosyltransferase